MLTKYYHITPSMSSPGTPLDNACAENFFSILKSEWLHRYTPATKEETRLLLGEYIHFYNYERIQLKTKLTPYEKTVSVLRNNELLRANQSCSTKCLFSCLSPWVHSKIQSVLLF